MNQEYSVDFATFCYQGDAERLHYGNQLDHQVMSNNYLFDNIMVIYQGIDPKNYLGWFKTKQIRIVDIDHELSNFGIDIDKSQYISDTDQVHTWKNHVVNHIVTIRNTNADYIVFADADCWIVNQSGGKSWVDYGIKVLERDSSIFIVSPNDGEEERKTLRMSQQMFMARVGEFRNANFNQPGYTGNPKDYDTMPEYHAMLEGRMEYHCRQSGQWRYVLGSEYRYWHHNRLNEAGHFETDRTKY